MAAYDVFITRAAPFHNAQISAHQRLALAVYGLSLEYQSTTDYTAASGQRTLVGLAVNALAGIPTAEFPKDIPPAQVAAHFRAAELQGGAAQTSALASLSSKLAAIPVWLACDDEVLAKTYVYLLTAALGALS